ncbi:MAG: GNAT family N-acetyltransferase [Verrucomicrobiales bacterium]|nr:GNAT family N-acetyltransferase [Verrucomicrobiales bacterium]
MNEPNPFLPQIDREYGVADMEKFGRDDRGAAFYHTALCYAQSHWLKGFPAKSLLLVNRALSLPLPLTDRILTEWPLPYKAVAWLLQQRPADQFIGNPRRHWQHLATRMVEPNKPLRTWRAWACWYLAKEMLPEAEFPGDHVQTCKEQVVEPTYRTILKNLQDLSPADDVQRWVEALRYAHELIGKSELEPVLARFRRIDATELPTVCKLAREIWREYYPGIITPEQVEYMLSVWYEPNSMAREMVARGTWFALIDAKGYGEIGYLSFEQLPGKPILFLNKLYLKPELQGRGIGAAALRWVADRCADLRCEAVQLRVNKSNVKAIRSYLRAGFSIIEEVCTDIGSGYFMDDYVMQRRCD